VTGDDPGRTTPPARDLYALDVTSRPPRLSPAAERRVVGLVLLAVVLALVAVWIAMQSGQISGVLDTRSIGPCGPGQDPAKTLCYMTPAPS
jgi:hypothetical protein